MRTLILLASQLLWGLTDAAQPSTRDCAVKPPQPEECYMQDVFVDSCDRPAGCVCSQGEDGSVGSTYESLQAAILAEGADVRISNCGNCGFCSTQHDTTIYAENENLAIFSLGCAFGALGAGLVADNFCRGRQSCVTAAMRKASDACLQAMDPPFTSDCQSCWTDNIVCDINVCLDECQDLLGLMPSLDKPFEEIALAFNDPSSNPELNEAIVACYTCDEVECGPAFKECSGANRRRIGQPDELLVDVQGTDGVCQTANSWPAPATESPTAR
jgi:hypothetical protein